MAITAKALVCQAIERRNPPRMPVNYCNRDFACSDTLATGSAPAADFVPATAGMSEWGFVWERLDDTMGQPTAPPLAEDVCLATYRPPDPYAPGRCDHLPAWTTANAEKFLKFGVGISGFNQATFLRGFEALLMDLYLEPAQAARVLDMVFTYENGLLAQAVQYPIDAVAFGDDWGTQQGLMIDPELWRKVFRPRYAEQFALIHAAGKKVWFHSCGNVAAIIGDLIDIGVDVLELLQPDVFGLDWLADTYGGQVCFCCAIDHQRRAISGTRQEIFDYARRLRDRLGDTHGGFIAYIEDYACLGMDETHYQWIREAFHGMNA